MGWVGRAGPRGGGPGSRAWSVCRPAWRVIRQISFCRPGPACQGHSGCAGLAFAHRRTPHALTSQLVARRAAPEAGSPPSEGGGEGRGRCRRVCSHPDLGERPVEPRVPTFLTPTPAECVVARLMQRLECVHAQARPRGGRQEGLQTSAWPHTQNSRRRLCFGKKRAAQPREGGRQAPPDATPKLARHTRSACRAGNAAAVALAFLSQRAHLFSSQTLVCRQRQKRAEPQRARSFIFQPLTRLPLKTTTHPHTTHHTTTRPRPCTAGTHTHTHTHDPSLTPPAPRLPPPPPPPRGAPTPARPGPAPPPRSCGGRGSRKAPGRAGGCA